MNIKQIRDRWMLIQWVPIEDNRASLLRDDADFLVFEMGALLAHVDEMAVELRNVKARLARRDRALQSLRRERDRVKEMFDKAYEFVELVAEKYLDYWEWADDDK